MLLPTTTTTTLPHSRLIRKHSDHNTSTNQTQQLVKKRWRRIKLFTPWIFSVLCFLWASFLTFTMMIDNNQNHASTDKYSEREIEKEVERRLISLGNNEDSNSKKKKREFRGPFGKLNEERAKEYERLKMKLATTNRDSDLEEIENEKKKKKKKKQFRGPFARFEQLRQIEFEKLKQKRSEEIERTKRALREHSSDDKDDDDDNNNNNNNNNIHRDTLDVEEKIQEALGSVIEHEANHDISDDDDDDDERRRMLIQQNDNGKDESAPTIFESHKDNTPKSVYGQAHLLNDLPGFPKTPPLVLSAVKPKAYLFRNFLTKSECDHLMKLAKAELAPSTVVGSGGTSVPSTIRTSAGMFLAKAHDSILKDIEIRIAEASGTPEPNGEGMQILRYDVGQKYDPHFDYFHDAVNPAPKRGGQRMATMLIYLENTEEGGETIFPRGSRKETFDLPEEGNPHEWSDCTSQGLPVKSVKGDALLFWSLTDDYQLDMGSLHGACPVVKGQKWTAVKWIRVAKFDGMFTSPLPMPKLSRRAEQGGKCLDEWDQCALWAKDGWCDKNKEFMTTSAGSRDSKGPACPVSCNVKCE